MKMAPRKSRQEKNPKSWIASMTISNVKLYRACIRAEISRPAGRRVLALPAPVDPEKNDRKILGRTPLRPFVGYRKENSTDDKRRRIAWISLTQPPFNAWSVRDFWERKGAEPNGIFTPKRRKRREKRGYPLFLDCRTSPDASGAVTENARSSASGYSRPQRLKKG